MTPIQALHTQAMNLAEQAELAKLQGAIARPRCDSLRFADAETIWSSSQDASRVAVRGQRVRIAVEADRSSFGPGDRR